ncbi:MAG: FecR domain-containing protein [Planctomycetota bacterium]|jgi:ferric-dicitrate binding protein FerR (iron transport regulator)
MDRAAIRNLMADFLEGEIGDDDRGVLAEALEQDSESATEFSDGIWVETMLRAAYEGDEAAAADERASTPPPVVAPKRVSVHRRIGPVRRASTYVWLGVAATLLVGVAVALVALAWGGKSREGPRLLTGAVEVDGARRSEIAPGELVSVVADAPAVVRLDDMSTAEFAPGSRAVFRGGRGEVRQLVELRAGKGTFRVEHDPRAFEVTTSLGSVTVTGTEFTVELREETLARAEARLVMLVAVAAGSVSVEHEGERTALTTGERRSFPPLPPVGAYSVNGELYVNVFGTPEGKALTTGHQDMKPSWSKTGGMLTFFRVTEFARDFSDWKTSICVVNADGTGFRKLTDGTHTDFNPTWTRDGSGRIIFNRRDPETRMYVVMQTEAGARPGDEVVISDTHSFTYAYSCLKDGRILVASLLRGFGYSLLTPGRDGAVRYEPVRCELAKEGLLDRISISPGETKICFEFQKGHGKHSYSGRTLYVADFDVEARAITNPTVIAEGGEGWDVNFPRWTADEGAVLYHCNRTGKTQIYMHRLRDGSTTRLSTDGEANYTFPNAEATPK